MKLVPFKCPKQGDADAIVDGKRIVDVRSPGWHVHDASILFDGVEIIGRTELHTEGGGRYDALLVRRRRPFLSFGENPNSTNAECARVFAIAWERATRRFFAVEVIE